MLRRNFCAGALFLFLLAFLSACTSLNVKIAHPPSGNAETLRPLRNIYLLIPPPEGKALEQAFLKLQESIQTLTNVSSDRKMLVNPEKISLGILGEKISAAFTASGFPLAGFQVGNRDDFKKFAPFFEPTSILSLRIDRFWCSVDHANEEKKVKDDAGRESKRMVAVWKVRGEFKVSFALESLDADAQKHYLSWQEGEALIPIEEKIYEEPDLDQWWQSHQANCFKKAAETLAEKILPAPVFCTRTIRSNPDKPLIKEGFLSAWLGHWKSASESWEKAARTEPTPMAYHDLAVAQEKLGNYAAALENYQQAENLARQKKESPLDQWGQIEIELKQILQSGVASCPQPASLWFQKKLAILPFSNESNFVEAPEWVQKRLREKLRERGYKILPQEEVNQKLREIGITDGGQLNAYPSSQIAKKLGSDLLLYGNILTLNEVPLGVYFKREVEISFKLTDASGNVIVETQKKIKKEKAAKGDKAMAEGIFELAKSLAERIAKVPFYSEISELVDSAFQIVPGK